MSNTRETNMSYQEQAIKLLANGFKEELIEYIQTDEKFIELVMVLTDKFIDDNIPVRGEQNRTDLAFLMFETLKLSSY